LPVEDSACTSILPCTVIPAAAVAPAAGAAAASAVKMVLKVEPTGGLDHRESSCEAENTKSTRCGLVEMGWGEGGKDEGEG